MMFDESFDARKFDEVKQITIGYSLVGYKADISRIYLGEKADLVVSFYDEKGMVKVVKVVSMEGDDYKRWGTDDEYIYQYINANLDKIIMEEK